MNEQSLEGSRVEVRWALGGRLDELWVEVGACRMGGTGAVCGGWEGGG